MKWAKFDQVKPGDVLIADGGFTCLKDGERCTVAADDKGLYVPCSGARENAKARGGKHYLDGQLDDGDVLIGFTPAAAGR